MEVIVEKEFRKNGKQERWTSREEEKVWTGFYRKAGDPVVAADLMEQMEADSDVKARHLGLYIRCKQSLRHEKARRARVRFAAQLVQAMVRMLCVRPVSVARGVLQFLGAVVVMTTGWDEPAVRQMRNVRRGASASGRATSPVSEPGQAASRQA
jgi:hypothetical protein